MKPPDSIGTTTPSLRVLIAGDDPTSMVLLSAILRKQGFQVVEAVDGEKAWSLFQRPDAPLLAVLDWMMPGCDGLELVRRVRALPNGQAWYLIMLTAKGEKDHLIRALENGADDYLAKPFDTGELRARVEAGCRILGLQAKLEGQNAVLTRFQRQMERELRLAEQLQRQLMDHVAIFSHTWEVFSVYKPSLSVGGDFFDAFPLVGGHLCIFIGDVSGHGVASAMLSNFLKIKIRDIVRDLFEQGPAVVCAEVNEFMHENGLNAHQAHFFATLFLAFYDPASERWRGFSCGHPLPLVLGENGGVKTIATSSAGGLPLGAVLDSQQFSSDNEVEWVCTPGDVLLAFTDGLFEARHTESEELCGIQKLREAAEEMMRRSALQPNPAELLRILVEWGYVLQGDDCCAVTVRKNCDTQKVFDLIEDDWRPYSHQTMMRNAENAWYRYWAKDLDGPVLDQVQSCRSDFLNERDKLHEKWAVAMREYLVMLGYDAQHGHIAPVRVSLQVNKTSCLLIVSDQVCALGFQKRQARFNVDAPLHLEGVHEAVKLLALASPPDFLRMGQINYVRFRFFAD